MARLVPLDGAKAIEYQTPAGMATYRKQRDGTVRVGNEGVARALVREGLAFVASATGPVFHVSGWACGGCGRRNYFRTCGACGSDQGRRER